jgi:histidinol-phosphate aminotransferase
MSVLLAEAEKDFIKRGFSRRGFNRAMTLLAAGSSLPFYNEAALAQRGAGMGRAPMSPDAVKINSNENPMGPCKEACEAMAATLPHGGRYGSGDVAAATQLLADIEGLKPGYIQMFVGSSDPLHRFVMASVSKDHPLVVGDPGYEAPARAAQYMGADTIYVPLTKGSMIHDVKAMVAAHKSPGLLYVCNPNNPTGTCNSKEDIEWLVANKPAGSVLLLDEAYIHLSKATPGSYLVAQDKDVIILRTFSKLYGMAGIRAGAAFARPDLMKRVAMYGTGFMPITSMAAVTASLQVKDLVTVRRKIIADIREETFSFLAKNNIEFLPSDANMFMMNVKRPGREFAAAMANHNVYIGRTWGAMPNWVRVTVGTSQEMAKFRDVCLTCYNA